MLLKNKNFIYLWISQILSQLTVHMMNFLLLARIYEQTASTIATSILWVSFALPTVFFGPLGAVAVDIFSRKKILVLTNLMQALVLVLYYFTHESSIFMLYIVVMAYSFLNQFYVPAEMATLPSLVNEKNLTKANSLFFLTQQLTLILGFGFAGIMQNIFGFKQSLLLSSIFLLFAFVSVSLLPKQKSMMKSQISFEELLKTFFSKIVEGYLYIKNKKSVLYPLGLLFFVQAGLAIIITILPKIASDILTIDISFSGIAIVVPAGLGGLSGAYLLNKLLKHKWRKKKIIETGLFTLSLSVVLLVFTKSLFAILPIFLIGLGFVLVNITTLTFLQTEIPTWIRGRVFGNLFFFVTIVTIMPVIFSGIFSEIFGVKSLLTIMALSATIVLTYSIRNGDRLIKENF